MTQDDRDLQQALVNWATSQQVPIEQWGSVMCHTLATLVAAISPDRDALEDGLDLVEMVIRDVARRTFQRKQDMKKEGKL